MSILSTLKTLVAPRELFSRAGHISYGHGLIAQSASLDLETHVGDPLQNGVVAACVNAIARALPDAPLLLEQRDAEGWKAVHDHECLRVLRAPNEDYSDADVWGLTSGYKATRGQAFWILLPDKLGRVGEIHVWNPDLVTVLGDADHFISGYRVQRESGGFIDPPFDKRQVIHFRHLPDFHNPRLGWNPLRAGRAQIAGDNIGASYHTSILFNAGVVSLLISLKEGAATGQVTPDQFQQVLSNIRRASRERSGGVEGINLPLEVHKLAYSPDEMNVDKLIQYYETRICSVMGVSQRVAGLGSDPTYNNLSEALSDFWERRIVPDRNADAATLNRQWLPLFNLDDGNWRFRFDYSGVPALQENRDGLHARVRADWEKGLVDKKQARALLGYGTESDGAFAGVFYGDAPKTTTEAPEGELSTSQIAEVKMLIQSQWDESEHPRDERGRFTDGTSSGSIGERIELGGSERTAENHLLELLTTNKKLGPQNHLNFANSLKVVIQKVPVHLHPRIIRNVREIAAFDDLDQLRDFGAFFLNLDPTAVGAYIPRRRTLMIDGAEVENKDKLVMGRTDIYAHEITHSLDYVGGKRISASAEWEMAYKQDAFLAGISSNASRSPKEGFAEIGRLFYARNDTHVVAAELEKWAPNCLKIWRKEKLVP